MSVQARPFQASLSVKLDSGIWNSQPLSEPGKTLDLQIMLKSENWLSFLARPVGCSKFTVSDLTKETVPSVRKCALRSLDVPKAF